MIPYYLLLARKHDALTGVPLVASFTDFTPVLRAYEETAANPQFAAEYAEIQLIKSGDLIRGHQYPHPVHAEAGRVQKLQEEALQVKSRIEKAAAVYNAAGDQLHAAKSAVDALSPEQISFLRSAEAKSAAPSPAEASAANSAEISAAEQDRIAKDFGANEKAAAAAAAQDTETLAAATVPAAAEVPVAK